MKAGEQRRTIKLYEPRWWPFAVPGWGGNCGLYSGGGGGECGESINPAPHRLGHTFAQAGVEALKHLGGGQGEVVLVFWYLPLFSPCFRCQQEIFNILCSMFYNIMLNVIELKCQTQCFKLTLKPVWHQRSAQPFFLIMQHLMTSF